MDLKVIAYRGSLVTESRLVAGMVDKPHDQLMRSIRTYVEYMDSAKLQTANFFIESTYINSQNKEMPCYLITKKGCDMVANKMTGEKGILFTAAYVTRFEEMEESLKPKLPKTYKEALLQLVVAEEEKEKLQEEKMLLEQQKQIMQPKSDYFDNLVDRNLLTNYRNTAKELGIGERKFVQYLLDKGYIYRDKYKKINHYSQYNEILFKVKDWGNQEKAGIQSLITPKGKETFRLLLVKDGFING